MRVALLFPWLFIFLQLEGYSQTEEDSLMVSIDSLYREDQFYLGFTYNILTDLPEKISSSGFSGGFQLGFIRDFPLNQRRNLAVGAGVGWAINTYGQTLFIGEEASTEASIFQSLEDPDLDYDSNRFTIQSIEVPLQLRWRTSGFESHKFWRVYGGVQLGYIYYFRSKFEQPGNIVKQTDVPELERLRMGATFAFGYNTFNFHIYYGLNPFFEETAKLEGQEIKMNTIRVGLMFFIL